MSDLTSSALGGAPPACLIRVLLVGLGATGMAVGRSLLQRADCELVGAVDPAFAGQDLGELLGSPSFGQTVAASLDGVLPKAADVAFVATTSWLEDVQQTAIPLLERGINVLSICEELAFPWRSHPGIAERLDRISRQRGVSLLGTGCNPGFLLDTLPVVLSSMTQQVSRVEVRRTADMSGYAAILEKFGLGLTIDEFDAAQLAGTVVGHVGFEQAMAALAGGLGWTLDDLEIDPVRPAFVTPRQRHGDHLTVPAGAVTAVTHSARARSDERLVISLSINFGIFEPGDPIELGDRILLLGEEQNVEVVASRGFDSFRSTVAMVVNVIGEVVAAPPGLLTMADLPVGALGSKGARRSPLSAHAG